MDSFELSKNAGQQNKGNESGVHTQLKEVSKKTEKTDRAASFDKLAESPKTEEATRINPKESSLDKACRIISDNLLEAPIIFVGLTALSVETRTKVSTFSSIADKRHLKVPKTLLYIPSKGLSSTIGTCLYAAA